MFFFKKRAPTEDTAPHEAANRSTSPSPQQPDRPLTPLEQAEALRAQGKASEAMDLLGRTILQTRDAALMPPAVRWLENTALLDDAGELAVCRFVAMLTQVIDPLDPPLRQKLWDGSLNALRRIERPVPRHDVTDRYTAECILLRHMGKTDEALQVALDGVSKHDTASNSTFAGLCYLDKDEPEKAEQYVRRGVELDPENLSPCNDAADYFFQNRNFLKAREYYGLVLENGDELDCDWAEPSWYFCQWKISGDALDLDRLILCAACRPENERAARLCAAAQREMQTPYVDYFIPSMEATVNMMPQLAAKDISKVKMALSSQESASSVNAIRLALSKFGQRPAVVRFSVGHIPDPPLDEVLIPEGVRLWAYHPDHSADPAVDRPNSLALQRVKELAQRPYHLRDWYHWAGELAQGLDADDLYGCMVYPPMPDGDIQADHWLLLVQFAAVCLLARLGGKYIQPQSEEMRTYVELLPSPELARICLGQLDWPVIPALTLLAWQAKEGLAHVDAAASIMSKLLRRVPKNDFCFFEHALVCALTWFPGQDESFYTSMRERRQALEE